MKKFQIPEQAASYTSALGDLISVGVCASHTLEMSSLVEMPIAVDRVGIDASSAVRADEFIGALRLVIEKRLQGRDAETAESLFALGESAGIPAAKRYEKTAAINATTWEAFRKEPLNRFLYTVYLALYREGEQARVVSRLDAGRSVASDRQSSSPVGGDYVLAYYENLYNFPAQPGLPREFVQTRQIVATRDNVQTWRQSSRWWGKGALEVPQITHFGLGKFSIVKEKEVARAAQPSRAYVMEVRFAEALKAGDSARFVLHRTQDIEYEQIVRPDYRDTLSLYNVVTPIKEAVLAVRFPESVRPRRAWHYEDLPDFLVPGEAAEHNELQIDEFGYLTYSWDEVRVGYCYGLAWEW